MSIYNWEIRKHIECSEAELKALLPDIDLIIRLSEKSRREGLLSLEDDLKDNPDPLLRRGIMHVINGMDPERLREILERHILIGGSTGASLRRELIFMEGTLGIQSGENPRNLREILNTVIAPFENGSGVLEPDFVNTLDHIILEIEKKGPSSGNTSLIEFIGDLDDRSIQLILREVDSRTLPCALSGAGSDVVENILRNMGSRGALILMEDIEYNSDKSEDEIRICQEHICDIFSRLKEHGEL